MASVVGYWQVADDEQAFLEYLSTTGDVVAISGAWLESPDLFEPVPIADFIERDNPSGLLFGLRKLFDMDKYDEREFEGRKQFCIPHMNSNSIGYDRGLLAERRLPLSNLSMYSSFPDASVTAMVTKNREFLAWAKKVMNWARKRTPEKLFCNGYPYRATRLAATAAAQGHFEPVLY